MTLKKDSHKRIQTICLYFTLYLEGKLFRFLASHCIRCLSLTVLVETQHHIVTCSRGSRLRLPLTAREELFFDPDVPICEIVLTCLAPIDKGHTNHLNLWDSVCSMIYFLFQFTPFFPSKGRKAIGQYPAENTLCVF